MKTVFTSRVTKPLLFLESYPLIFLAGVFMMLGLAGVWVTMPLSGKLSLSELSMDKQAILLIAGISVLLYLVSTALKRTHIRLVIGLGLFLFLLTLAQSQSFFNGTNLWQFISESQQFRQMQHILSLNDVPNAGRAVEASLTFDAFKLSDRVSASVGLLGWGIKLALLCALFLALYAWANAQHWLRATLIVLVMSSATLLGNGTGNVALAYLKVNQGVRDINNDKAEEAIAQFNEAAVLDPVINYSLGFPLLQSFVAYRLDGPLDENANAYLMSQKMAANDFNGVLALKAQLQLQPRRFDRKSQPISRLEAAVATETLNRMGLLHLWRQEWQLAEARYREGLNISASPVAKLALLNIYQHTQQYIACNGMADELLSQLQNRSVVADIWTTKGDCLSASGRILEARNAFEQSVLLDSDKNYRAVKGLSGT